MCESIIKLLVVIVVVIATKRGQEGAPVITFNQKLSLMTPAYRPVGLNSYEFAQQRNEVEFASFQESPSFNKTALSKYYMGDLWQSGHNYQDGSGYDPVIRGYFSLFCKKGGTRKD